MGRIAQVIPDAPSLEVGRSYLFFLSGGVGTVRFMVRTLPLYDRIITRYEHNDLEVAKRTLNINGEDAKTYVIQQDYYFVMGDSRHYSADSRYWGFVPDENIVGKAVSIWMNFGELNRVGSAIE